MRSGVVFLSAALLYACGGGEPRPDTDELEIGAGASDGSPGFITLTDGQDVTLSPGAQGGFHIFLNIRVDAVDVPGSGALYVDRKARRESTDELVSQTRHRASMARSSDGYYDTAMSFRLFLCPTPIGIPVRDEMLVIRIGVLEDEDDTEPKAEGTIRLRPRCPSDQGDFCARICAG